MHYILWVDTQFEHLNDFIHDLENILNLTVLTSTSSGEALKLYETNAAKIKAVITNQKRPLPDGPEAGVALLSAVRDFATKQSIPPPTLLLFSRSISAEEATSKGFSLSANFYTLGKAICDSLGVLYVLPCVDPDAAPNTTSNAPTLNKLEVSYFNFGHDFSARIQKGRATAGDYKRIGDADWIGRDKVYLPDGRVLTKAQVYLEAIRLDPDNGEHYHSLTAAMQPRCPTGPSRVKLPNGRILNGAAEVLKYGLQVKKPSPSCYAAYRQLMSNGSAPANHTLPDGRVLDAEDMELEELKLQGSGEYPYRYALKHSKGPMVHLPNGTNMSRAEAERLLNEYQQMERYNM